jgi:hypothetical protein
MWKAKPVPIYSLANRVRLSDNLAARTLCLSLLSNQHLVHLEIERFRSDSLERNSNMTNTESQDRTSTKKQTASQRRATLDKRFTAYAVAASAAGVSLLALVQPAEGKIVYTGASSEIAPNAVLPLDLNHGGQSEFSFSNQAATCSGCHSSSDRLMITPIGQNGIMSHAAVLPAGAQVGPKGAFQNSAQLMLVFRQVCSATSCASFTSGAWKNITQGYLGLKFYIHGQAHYGWARLNVTLTQKGRVYALLTGYAYETVPNKSIITGRRRGPGAMSGRAGLSQHEPDRATLGALAKGAAGLAIWRTASAPGE